MEPLVQLELAQQAQQVLALQEPLVLQALMAPLELLALKVPLAPSASALVLLEPQEPLV
jgi:hypothetical protein